MRKTHYRTYYLWVSVLLLPALLCAQTQDSLEYTLLKSVSVQARSEADAPTAMPMQHLSSSQLEQLPLKDFSDAIKFMAGTQIRDYGGLGGIKTVSVRSLGATHTGVFYDYLPVSDCSSGQVNLGVFSQNGRKDIRLFSGSPDAIFHPARLLASASTLYIVNEIPAFSGKEIRKGSASFRCGSFQLYNPYLQLSRKWSPKLISSLSAEYNYQKGDYPYTYRNYKQTVSGRRTNAEVRNARIEGNLYYRKEQQLLTAKAYYYRSSQQLPGAIVYYNPVCKQHMEEENFALQLHYHHLKLFRSEKWQFQNNEKFSSSFLEYIDPDYLNAAHCLDNTYRQKEYYLSNTLMYRFAPSLSAALANDWTLNQLESNLDAFESPLRLGILTALSTRWEKSFTVSEQREQQWKAVFSLLHNACFDQDIRRNRWTQKWSPSANLLYSFGKETGNRFSLRMAYKNIFRMPTFSENYYRLFGSAGLQPEDVQEINFGGELQLKHKSNRRLAGSTDVFYNLVEHKIVATPSQNLFVWSMVNYGRVKIMGLECQLHYIDAELLKEQNIQLYADINYTGQRATDISNAASKTYLNQLPYTPKHTGSGRLGLAWKKLQLTYTLLYVGSRYTLGQNTDDNRLAAYCDHGLSTSWHYTADRLPHPLRFRLQLDALNLAGRHYEVIRNYPMPGRQFQAKISLDF